MINYTTSCPNWEELIVNKKLLTPEPIFKDEAQRALTIFKSLRVPDMVGHPTIAEVTEEWVFGFVGAIFGAYDRETKKRLIRDFFLLISKKNTKSFIGAGIMLTALIVTPRTHEDFLIIAPTKEIANNSYEPASGMVELEPVLQKYFRTRRHIRTIEHRTNGNSLKVIAADSDTVGGKRSGFVLVDELWLFGNNRKADGMLMEATGGLVSKPDGFVIYLSTQSDEPPAGVFKDKLAYARKVRDGEIEDKTILPVLYEFPKHYIENELYLKPENFYITNPNLGISVDGDWIETELKKAMISIDQTKKKFLAKHLNVQIDMALADNNWAGAQVWMKAEENLTIDDVLERSGVVTVGIDGGGLDDLIGLYVIGKDINSGKWLGWGKAWVTKLGIQRRPDIETKIIDFSNDGDIEIVDNVGDDLHNLISIIEKIYNFGIMDKIGCDPMGIGDVLDKLMEVGIPQEQIVGVSQGYRLGGAIKAAERRLADGTFKVARQNMMRWIVSNAKVEQRSNSILVTKQASGSAKIDPLMALFNAVTLMSQNPESQSGFNSFLEKPIIM